MIGLMICRYYKKEGQTMLEMLESFRSDTPQFKDSKITYSGRLDPLAFGEVIVLTDQDVYRKDEYNKLDKVYNFSILFGVSTDTGDILGIVQKDSLLKSLFRKFLFTLEKKHLDKEKIKKVISGFKKDYIQKYPKYSSFNIKGVPMWLLAKEGKLPIKLPSHNVTIYDISIKKIYDIDKINLSKDIKERILNIKGDFRQDQIVNSWDSFFNKEEKTKYILVDCQATVSSGTYIRQLCIDIGNSLNTQALAYSIDRQKIIERKRPCSTGSLPRTDID